MRVVRVTADLTVPDLDEAYASAQRVATKLSIR